MPESTDLPAVEHSYAWIEYKESIYETVSENGCTTTRVVGEKTMRCQIGIEVFTDKIARELGPRACYSKGGKCRAANGLVKVRRIGEPETIATVNKRLP